jgi:hypothetical protein
MARIFLIFLLLPLLSFSQSKISIGRLEAVDPEGEEVYWTITAGNTGGYFSITPCSGIVKMDTLAYDVFITQKTWTITFKATDPQGLYSKTVRKIVVKKLGGVKLPPTISNAI